MFVALQVADDNFKIVFLFFSWMHLSLPISKIHDIVQWILVV